MKFALRRRETVPTPDQASRESSESSGAEEPPAPPRPPRGSVVATYAEVLDGRALWLSFEAAPGRPALRRTDDAQVVPLQGDLAEDDTEHRSTRVDLLEVTVDGGVYDLVLVPPGGADPRPLWTAPGADRGPVATPAAPGGECRLELVRTEEGTLRLTRRAVPPAHELRGLSETPTSIELRVDAGPADAAEGGDAARLLLVGDDGPVASYPLDREGDLLHASLGLEALPEDASGRTRVGVGTPERWLPVRRAQHDLLAADDAVLLPALMGEDPERPRLKLQWRRGQLHAKLIRTDTPEDPA